MQYHATASGGWCQELWRAGRVCHAWRDAVNAARMDLEAWTSFRWDIKNMSKILPGCRMESPIFTCGSGAYSWKMMLCTHHDITDDDEMTHIALFLCLAEEGDGEVSSPCHPIPPLPRPPLLLVVALLLTLPLPSTHPVPRTAATPGAVLTYDAVRASGPRPAQQHLQAQPARTECGRRRVTHVGGQGSHIQARPAQLGPPSLPPPRHAARGRLGGSRRYHAPHRAPASAQWPLPLPTSTHAPSCSRGPEAHVCPLWWRVALR